MNILKRICILFIMLLFPVRFLHAEADLDYFFKNSDEYDNVLVKEVRSADQFVIINRQGVKEIIKMIGLKAPKAPKIKQTDVERDDYGFPIKKDADPFSSIEEQSFTFVKELLKNKKVRLEFDSAKKDEEDNTLAYVYLVENNMFVNVEILRQGMAELQVRPPNIKHKIELRQAYQEARQEKRGLQSE